MDFPSIKENPAIFIDRSRRIFLEEETCVESLVEMAIF